jgi:hypothetical protein
MNMPDLKSELKKLEALKFDDDGETNVINMPSADEQHGSVSVRLFNIIRDNPGCDRSRLLAKALAAGVGMSSSSSLLTQFTRRGLLRTVDSAGGLTYFVTSQQYKPGYIKQAKQAKKAAKVATPEAAKPAPQQDANVQELLNSMSIVKARALYDELKKIFGG